jgi:hypothetical protein
MHAGLGSTSALTSTCMHLGILESIAGSVWCDGMVEAAQVNGIDAVNTVTVDYVQAWIQ